MEAPDLQDLINLTQRIDHDRSEWEQLIRQLVAFGEPISHIARSAGISRTHVRRIWQAGR